MKLTPDVVNELINNNRFPADSEELQATDSEELQLKVNDVCMSATSTQATPTKAATLKVAFGTGAEERPPPQMVADEAIIKREN